MRKRTALILTLCLLFSTLCAAAGEQPSVSAVTYTDGSKPISFLTPGGTVAAQITAENFPEGERAIFLLALYRGGQMIDLAADPKVFASAGSTQFSARLTMPSDIADCSVKATLWSGIDGMKPLCTAGLFPSSETLLKGLWLDGVYLTDLETGEYTVADNLSSSPTILPNRMDGSADVRIQTTKTFPGKSVITVTAPDGTEAVYTLNFKCTGTPEDYITGFQSSAGNTLQFGLKEGSKAYSSDPNVEYVNLTEALKDAAYIRTVNADGSTADSFTLNRSATVMLLSAQPLSLPEGWAKDDSLTAQRYQKAAPSNPGYGAYEELFHGYSREYSVTDSPVAVTLPETGESCLAAVRFTYDEICGSLLEPEKPRVTNLKYLGPTNQDGAVFDGQPVYGTNFGNGKQLYTNYNNIVCNSLDPSLEGKDYIISFNPVAGTVPAFVKNVWYGSKGINWMSFDIRQSATIRVFTQGTIEALTWPAWGFTANTAPNGLYFDRLNTDWPNADRSKMDRMYTKYVEASEDSPATVKLPNAPYTSASKWGYVVVIDFDESAAPPEPPVPDSGAKITNRTYKGPAADGFDGTVQQGTLENGVFMYTNYTTVTAENISGELKGLPYLYTANPIAGSAPQTIKDAWGNKLLSWYTFDINKSANIYIYTDGDSLAYGNDGYTKETASTPYFQKKNNDSYTNMTIRYVKHIDVPEGETVTVSVPNTPWFGTAKWGHLVVVDFDE